MHSKKQLKKFPCNEYNIFCFNSCIFMRKLNIKKLWCIFTCIKAAFPAIQAYTNTNKHIQTNTYTQCMCVYNHYRIWHIIIYFECNLIFEYKLRIKKVTNSILKYVKFITALIKLNNPFLIHWPNVPFSFNKQNFENCFNCYKKKHYRVK